jgi:hypothetical protein
MTKLNQLIAVESGLKTSTTKAVTEVFRNLNRINLFTGITRTYAPKDDEGDKLPAESTLVQTNVKNALEAFQSASERLFDVTLTKERANAQAAADVVVDGKAILKNVPVTYLLFLEKKLVDINTFVLALPTLDPSSVWVRDENTGNYVTEPVQTVRTKKVPRNWVKAPATDKHPAQVEIFHEDVIVGTWTKRDLSGAIPVTVKADLLERVEKLSSAVKFAREEANSAEVKDDKAADAVFTYLFG